jgi:hypothetical protein
MTRMGTTANYGLPYPEPAHTPDVPRDMKALADAVDVDLSAALSKKVLIEAHTVMTVVPGSGAQVTVSFTGFGAKAPAVLVTLHNTFGWWATIQSQGAGAVNIRVWSAPGANVPDGTQIEFSIALIGVPADPAVAPRFTNIPA